MTNTQQNLIPLQNRCKEDAMAIRSKGGYARAKAIRERKTMKQAMIEMLQKKPKDFHGTDNMMKQMGIDPKGANNQDVLLTMLYQRACFDDKSSVQATQTILKMIGEDIPQEEINGQAMEEHNASIQEFNLKNNGDAPNRQLEDFE